MNTQKENFRKAVLYALQYQNEFVETTQTGKTNPYYLGFGNPESDIIIYGQEKAIPANNTEQIWLESNQNPNQWEKYLNGEINDKHQLLYPDTTTYYQNPIQPYAHYPNRGTWKNYQTIISSIYPEIKRENTEATFLERTFITEINHAVAVQQMGYQNDTLRNAFLQQAFFRDFPVTVLAIGNYLKQEAIEAWFEVVLKQDLSNPYRKLLVYKSSDNKRLVLQTRQMSILTMKVEDRIAYFEKIKNLIDKHIISISP